MKRLITVLLLALSLTSVSAPAMAAEESIADYFISMDVLENGDLTVSESITYDFAVEPKRGIYRLIPVLDNLPNNQQQLYEVEVLQVLMDGQPAPYTANIYDDFLEVRIGDENQFISGKHTYFLNYTIKGGLRTLESGLVDFYWDVVGDQWSVPIARAAIDIRIPAPAVASKCTYGPVGSTTVCPGGLFGSNLQYQVVDLNPNEAVTVSAQIEAAAFSQEIIAKIQSAPEGIGTQIRRNLPIGLILGLIIFIALIVLARRKAATVETAAIREFIRFEVPDNLRPAEVAVAWKGKLDAPALTATMLDLASRDVIALTFNEDDHMVITRSSLSKVTLAPWEQELLTSLFAGDTQVVLGEYQPHIESAVQNAEGTLLTAAEFNGRRNAHQGRYRKPWTLAAIGAGVLTFLSFFTLPLPAIFSVLVPVLFATAAALFVGSRLIPLQQTERSADFLSQVKGFEKALDTDAAEDRREFAHRSGLTPINLFATMLPFAVIYGLQDSWVKSFPAITPQELASAGLGFASITTLNSQLDNATASFASSAQPPSSSGDGSGGGSSGGGSGGGGGGSW